MDALGFSRAEIENVLRKGMKWQEKGTQKWHAQMAGIEVVFQKEEGITFIITVYQSLGRT